MDQSCRTWEESFLADASAARIDLDGSGGCSDELHIAGDDPAWRRARAQDAIDRPPASRSRQARYARPPRQRHWLFDTTLMVLGAYKDAKNAKKERRNRDCADFADKTRNKMNSLPI